MGTPTPRKRYAAAGDWGKHRGTITALYIDQKRPLKVVMQIMERDHQFLATDKLYKTRLARWGVHKNLRHARFRVTPSFSEEGEPSGLDTCSHRSSSSERERTDGTASSSEPQRPDEGRVAQDLIEKSVAPRTRSSPSVRTSLRQPDGLRLPEECLQLIHRFTRGRIDSGFWPATNPKDVAIMQREITWSSRMFTATSLFNSSHLIRKTQSFRLISVCFDQYRNILRLQGPFLMLSTLFTLFQLSGDATGLAPVFVNYAFEMSNIVLGTTHPLTLLLQRFRAAGWFEIATYAPMLIQCYLAAACTNNPFIEHVQASVRQEMASVGHTDASTTRRTIDALLTDLAADQHGHRLTAGAVGQATEPYHDGRRCFLNVAEEDFTFLEAQASCYGLLRIIAMHERDCDKAIEYSYKYVQSRTQLYGICGRIAATVLVSLESLLRSVGRVEEADRIRRGLDDEWDRVCKRLGQLTL